MNLSKVIFWDTDFEKIDWEGKAQYVIERVVRYGTLSDWREIQAKYGMARIQDAVLNFRELDPKTLAFLSILFEIPKHQFRCYTSTQSPTGYWNY